MKVKSGYLIVLLGVLLSGNPAFSFVSKQVDLVVVGVVMLMLMLANKIMVTNKFLMIMAAFIFIFICQSIRDGSFTLYTELGFLLILFIGFAMQSLVKDFPKQYVNVMFHLGLLSLLFYIPAQIGHFVGVDFKSWFQWARADLGESYFDIYVHNFRIPGSIYNANQEWRNAGIFWEPGAFSGYLIVGLLLLSSLRNELSRVEFKRTFTVLTVCLLTTASTAGYVIFPLVYFIFFVTSEEQVLSSKVKKYVISFLVFVAILPVVAGLPFMQEKMSKQFDLSNSDEDVFAMTRLGGFTFDYNSIIEKPLVGWGPDPTLRWKSLGVDEKILFGQGNGLTGFTIRFGLIGISLYFLVLYHALGSLKFSKVKRMSFILCITLLLIGEFFLNYVLFLSLMFMRYSVDESSVELKNRYND